MVEELKINWDDMREVVETFREKAMRLFPGSDVKFVGVAFYFLVDDEMLIRQAIISKGVDLEEFDE